MSENYQDCPKNYCATIRLKSLFRKIQCTLLPETSLTTKFTQVIEHIHYFYVVTEGNILLLVVMRYLQRSKYHDGSAI